MSLIVEPPGESARPLKPIEIPQELSLQDFVVENPESLPFRELRSELQFVMVAKELPTSSGSIDAAGVDDEGNVYLIETKLFRNADKRRVLAQVLDYGAALWRDHGDPRTFVDKLDAACQKLLGRDLAESITRSFDLDPEQADEVVQGIESVVQDGRFRFVILMDRLDDRLKDLVGFINENSQFDVFAVEFELYEFDDYEAVIPRLYGAEVRKVVPRPPPPRRKWDKSSFFAEVEKNLDGKVQEAVRRLYKYSVEHAEATWGTGVATGSFNTKYHHLGTKSVFSVYSSGVLSLNFAWHHEEGAPLPEPIRRMAEHVNEIRGIALPDGYEDTYSQFEPEVWAEKTDDLIAVFRETLEPR